MKAWGWAGPTPRDVVEEAVAAVGGEVIVVLEGPEIALLKEVWNQGIDRNLDALSSPNKVSWIDKDRTRAKVFLTEQGFLVFVRRLYELSDERGMGLRKAMLDTVGVREEP